MHTGERSAAREALVRISSREAALRRSLHDRIREVVRWLDLHAPAYRARVGEGVYERERGDFVKLVASAYHDALSPQDAAVLLDFMLFYANTVAETLEEEELERRRLTWLL